MDQLKELSIQLGGKIRTQNLYNWNYDRTSLRELVLKDYKGYKIAVADFGDLFELGIKVESDFSFAINLPDKIFCHNTPSVIVNFPYKVYFSNYENTQMPHETIDFQQFFYAFLDKIKLLLLSENEGVFYYENLIEIILNADRNLIPILDDLIELIDSNPIIFEKKQKGKDIR